MEYIVCNNCGSSPSKQQFYITACSHVFCGTCLSPSFDFCKLCKIPTKSLKLDGKLPKNVQNLFGDPAEMATELNRQFLKTVTFQKTQKAMLAKLEKKKSIMRKEQQEKIQQKTQEITGQMGKLEKVEEVQKRKLKNVEAENLKLEKEIEKLQLELSKPSQEIDDDDDFFLKGTPTASSPSVGSSNHDDDIFEFDLLGLKVESSDSLTSQTSSSNCSSQSTAPGPLF